MKSLGVYLKHYKKESIIAPLFKLLEVVFDLLVPMVVAQIIDVGIAGNNRPYIVSRFGILVLMAAVGLCAASPRSISRQKRASAVQRASPGGL